MGDCLGLPPDDRSRAVVLGRVGDGRALGCPARLRGMDFAAQRQRYDRPVVVEATYWIQRGMQPGDVQPARVAARQVNCRIQSLVPGYKGVDWGGMRDGARKRPVVRWIEALHAVLTSRVDRGCREDCGGLGEVLLQCDIVMS